MLQGFLLPNSDKLEAGKRPSAGCFSGVFIMPELLKPIRG